MTVSEMITILCKLDPEAEVKMHRRGGKHIHKIFWSGVDDGQVWIESESDKLLRESGAFRKESSI